MINNRLLICKIFKELDLIFQRREQADRYITDILTSFFINNILLLIFFLRFLFGLSGGGQEIF